MQKLIFRNANGTEIDLTSGDYGITEWEGFSADDLNIQTQSVPFQDGAVFLDALMNQRELTVTVAMQDNNDLEKRYRLRREMISSMNPKLGEGVLIYTNDYLSKQIHVVPQLPVFQNKNSNDSGTPKAQCSFTACEPYWEDLEETSIFIKAGSRTPILNEGDVPTGVKVDLFTTDVTNPQVKNFAENKLVKLNGTFQIGIKIDTNVGKKQILSQEIVIGLSNIGVTLNATAYSEDLELFVTIGRSGTILTSSDGINWTPKNSGVDVDLNSIVYSEELNIFVIVGAVGRILTSSDGINWSRKTSGVNVDLKDITYSEDLGLFVVAGGNGTILTSSDGINWKVLNSGITNTLDGVSYNKEQGSFFIVGNQGMILKSTFTQEENLISSLTPDSNMTLGLEVGSNDFLLSKQSGNLSGRVTYRQKYIGV